MDEVKRTLILTVGLPQSGKSTWAQMQQCPIVNPDSIRLALHGKPFVSEAEPFVWAIAKCMVNALFLAGHDTVVLDATNTTRKRRDEWKSHKWTRSYFEFERDPILSKQRAEHTCQDEGHYTGLAMAIERMHEQYEPVEDDEGMERLNQ